MDEAVKWPALSEAADKLGDGAARAPQAREQVHAREARHCQRLAHHLSKEPRGQQEATAAAIALEGADVLSRAGVIRAGGSRMLRRLYYGDNLDVLQQHVAPASVDLVYLDPPFKSDANYNLLFSTEDLKPDEAQWTAFKDTWIWDTAAQKAFEDIQELGNVRLAGIVNALHGALGTSRMMAYLVNMALRLHYVYRAMKPTASLYLHCDPTASHYLKALLDAIFGPTKFRNEIVWRRTGSHNKAKRWAPIHDTIFFYTKSDKYTWNRPRRPYMRGHVQQHFGPNGSGGYRTKYFGNVLTGSGTRNGESGKRWRGFDPTAKGRHWAIPGGIWDEVGVDPDGMSQHEKLDLLLELGAVKIVPGESWPIYEMAVKPGAGPAAPDIWAFQPYTEGAVFGSKEGIDADARWLSPQDEERLGYPTQKPVGLLSRIIEASSQKGDVVLDPFCGCGTTIDASERLGRQWVGIDISPFAIQLIRRVRIDAAFPSLKAGIDYQIDGLPTTLDGAKMMAEQDKKAFELWAVATIGGWPDEKKGADKGIDGRVPFRPDGPKKAAKFAVVSVKGGKNKADDIRALIAVAQREKVTSLGFGVLVVLNLPTKSMRTEAAEAGMTTVAGIKYQMIQILTVEEILKGARPRLPFYDPAAIYRRALEVTKGIQGDLLEDAAHP